MEEIHQHRYFLKHSLVTRTQQNAKPNRGEVDLGSWSTLCSADSTEEGHGGDKSCSLHGIQEANVKGRRGREISPSRSSPFPTYPQQYI